MGTGTEVTIDTAGSDFDTAIAVYTAAAHGSLEPVDGACVDDVPLEPVGRTLQAAVTDVRAEVKQNALHLFITYDFSGMRAE